MTDRLVIGYESNPDKRGGRENDVMVIMRENDDHTVEVLQTFYDSRAHDLYCTLLGKEIWA